MRRVLTVLVVALPLVFGGCGGKSSSSSSTSAYCKALRDAAKEAAAEAKKSTSTTASVQATRERIDTAFKKLTAHAPSELKDDYKVVQDYYTLYLDSAADPAKADRTKLSSLAPKAQTAGKNIADYNKKVCKFDSTSSSVAPATKR